MAELRPFIVIINACALIILSSVSVGAQSPADQFARDRSASERRDRLGVLAGRTPERLDDASSARPAIGDGGRCFPVDKIVVDDASLLPKQDIATVTGSFSGRCIGLGAINLLLRNMTDLYLDRGYITSRVYVPEQDIGSSRTLRLKAVEGVISDIYLDGKPAPHSGELETAFPGLRGRAGNIHDIEQGLDQIDRLASSQAKSTMLPGADPGTAILNVDIEHGLPWQVSVGNNNLGQEQTGLSRSTVQIRRENLFDLNDLFSFTYEHSGPDYPGNGDGRGKADNYSALFSIPWGYWTFSGSGAWYEYKSEVPGNFASLSSSGTSGEIGVSVDRVLWRGPNALTQLHLALTYKETENFLLGNRIEVGSRRYTVGSIGLTHSRRMLGGVWAFDANVEQGLDLFGAVDEGEPSAGGADPRFTKFTGSISADTPFELGNQSFIASSIANAQVSGDSLFGSEQMSLGSYSNVRGTRDGVLYGNNGFFIRNDIVWRIRPWSDSPQMGELFGEVQPYVGLDYGRVFSEARHDIEGGFLSGWTIGMRLSGGKINLDFGYSDILATSSEQRGEGLMFFSANASW
ncbi:ShlB/FhaC/HecB family hemolysin secretion/activation protein [Ciceribacter sp. RN22]|uniref:ShlB/FhaC/HecB family hemolysin secretion/activation protein n=1 Tax=Ciceribacter sp. RN22 TaxID=2954932 RepID=UPI002093ED78|nr:ShlB/FhaC/HecB family hemolysin secretion/activation protein [Ciceribacter sp. RN22]MCO6180756.1 ShlB/FhaC/HecB family hemolysin secretion/activation protein [Ciceribacter sp. RN22]